MKKSQQNTHEISNRLLRPQSDNRVTKAPFAILLAALLFVVGVGLACNQPSENGASQTQIALNVQATSLAQQESQGQQLTQAALDAQAAVQNQQATDDALAGEESRAATEVAQNVQATVVAQQATELAQTAFAPTPTFTETPPPTATTQPPPTDAPPTQEPPPAQPPTEQPPQEPAGNLDEMIQNSKILLFEDITKIFLARYVKEALDGMGLSRNYTDVKDAVGHLKTQLLSGLDWDLIIIAVEARTGVQGEYFDYINEQINRGTSIIMEHWNLDDLSGGRAATILTRCGVRISDWWDPPLTGRSIWPLYGEHPIWHEPNEGMSLTNYSPYWFGDAGDLMKTIPGSEAVLLAGTIAQEKNSYGTLVSCIEGRFIIQTYSSHDYHREDVVRLWQNYIYNGLRAHFEYEASH
jgi:hypothetical protein